MLSSLLLAISLPACKPSIGRPAAELSKAILVIFQDKQDRYWFGSDGEGVYRYDGKALRQFTAKDGLPHDRVREIQQDKAGNIYIGTLGGITKFDGNTFSTLKPVRMKTADEGWRLHPDDLWFKGDSTVNGPYRYDGKTLYHLMFPKHFLEARKNAEIPNPPASFYGIYTFYRDRKGHLWLGTASLGAARYDGKSIQWVYENHLTDTPEGGSIGIRGIVEGKDGRFWFSNTRYRFNVGAAEPASKDLVGYKREEGSGADYTYFMSIVEGKERDLWMATYQTGIMRFDGKRLTRYPIRDEGKDATTFTIIKDRQGDLWVGTHAAGVYKFNGKSFEQWRPYEGPEPWIDAV